ncbi:hypothetical protein JTE90_014605 [Oedothorax gibbosus]|uniref:Uncharacterized protein n=1 Tax=Oedothorax gibbosus TaxID=931172 RepID=A0AAV6V7W7_9ARAC|nr:hypothetical protein JTE90_014605 [Oedothorax gibbosus]
MDPLSPHCANSPPEDMPQRRTWSGIKGSNIMIYLAMLKNEKAVRAGHFTVKGHGDCSFIKGVRDDRRSMLVTDITGMLKMHSLSIFDFFFEINRNRLFLVSQGGRLS